MTNTTEERPVGANAEKEKGHRLVIHVVEEGKPKTNIRIPLNLARMGIKFVPAKEKENLKEQGIDLDEILGELTGEEVGPLVEVEQEGKTVYIAVE